MLIVARIVIGIIGLAAASQFFRFAVYLVWGAVEGRSDPLLIFFLAFLGPIMFLALWFAFFGADAAERARMGLTLKIAAAVGVIGFLGGFILPMILTPEANQGPMMGIFLTGPAGLALGCIGGFIWARRSM
jgi:hypothetical protein